jgi:signal peptidase I
MADIQEATTSEAAKPDATKIPSAKSELALEALSWAKTIVFAVALALLVNNFVIVNTSVLSGSMENTIMTNDRVVAFRLSYLFSDPERYDIVVFRYPEDESKLYVKRIVGLPGETIEVRQGDIYINGSDTPLRNDFVRFDPVYTAPDFAAYTIPEGEYFMMGDNRDLSDDSRRWGTPVEGTGEWENKTVERGKILGKAIFRYWPGLKNLIGA